MTPEARAAAEAAINTALQHMLVLAVLGWWAWYAWRKWGPRLPDLRPYFTRQTLDTAPAVNLTEGAQSPPDERTDGRTDQRDAAPAVPAFLRVDRTRKAVVKALVASGWSVAQIRAVVKGENAALSAEIAEARAELDGTAPRTLVVRDAAGERTIAL
jgi:hypothetical protein